MALTNYSELQTAITTAWPNRTDLAAIAPDIITVAEARLNRDKRVRVVQERSINVSADSYDLPTDFASLVSLSHDGPTFYGGIEIVGPSTLPEMKMKTGKTGAPQFASVIDTLSPNLRFAPVPNASFALKMTYDAKLTSLSDTDTNNWLLDSHPDIYLFACLVEMEGYLLEDERMGLWEHKLEQGLSSLNIYTQRIEFGGKIVARPSVAFGG